MLKLSLLLFTAMSLAGAQEIQPVPQAAGSQTPSSGAFPELRPMPAPAPTSGSASQAAPNAAPTATSSAPAPLSGVDATLSVLHRTGTALTLGITLKSKVAQSSGAPSKKLEARRENQQDCAVAPMIRVLKVGSREVLYPAGLSPKICPQDMKLDLLAPGGILNYSRDIQLPAGDYMIEGWWQGIADGQTAKAAAQPIRVTVK